TAIYTLIAVVLIAALAVGCTFTGANEDDENLPWLWAKAAVPEQMTENDENRYKTAGDDPQRAG
ncbi:MAG: hypothetical protein Q4C13_02715, partial [Clostridia bacterium]|nr:hypothetical protein [Clostridia bacterium]